MPQMLESSATPQPAARLRVCHVSMTLKTGGLERLLVEFARFHDAQRFDLCFVALEDLGPPARELMEAGYPVTSVKLSRVGKWQAIKQLRDFFKEQQIDVLHTHNTYPYFYGALAGRLAGIKTIINTQHGRGCGDGWKSLWQFRIANRLSSRVIGVSQDATRLCQNQDPFSAGAMRCIWNGIDVERFRFCGPKDELTAISVARLSPEKDFATLLRATRLVIDDHPDFQLKIVGDGVERPHLERLTDELRIRDHVQFLGERKDVPDLLKTAGFFVSSSKTEGVSLTLLEAMAVGLPIVTTAVGGSPEVVADELTGRLVPPLNPDALASAMKSMILERSLWRDMGISARARVERFFNVRKMVAAYEETYLECHATR